MIEPVILHVEDDDASYFIWYEIFKEVCPDIRIERARDGAEALEKIGSLVADPMVDLRIILLDVVLPNVDGWAVLKSIRAEKSLEQLPVVVLTSSLSERDRAKCLALGAEYKEKPGDLGTLILFVKEICEKAHPQPM